MRTVLLASLVIMHLSGCVSSKVASNKDPNFNQKPTKIYLILQTPKYSSDFKEVFQKTFLEEMGKKNILCFYESPDPLALETAADQQKRIAESGADVVMTFTQTEGTTSSGGATPFLNGKTFNNTATPVMYSGVFDVKMFTPSSDLPVWRANIDVGAMNDFAAGAYKTAKKLIAQMMKDGLI